MGKEILDKQEKEISKNKALFSKVRTIHPKSMRTDKPEVKRPEQQLSHESGKSLVSHSSWTLNLGYAHRWQTVLTRQDHLCMRTRVLPNIAGGIKRFSLSGETVI